MYFCRQEEWRRLADGSDFFNTVLDSFLFLFHFLFDVEWRHLPFEFLPLMYKNICICNYTMYWFNSYSGKRRQNIKTLMVI